MGVYFTKGGCNHPGSKYITGKLNSDIYHWLRIITRLSAYIIENLTWILYKFFYNVSGESDYDYRPVI